MEPSPSAYAEGYARARRHDRAAADNYIRHTTIGDPVLDPIMEELSSLPPAVLHHSIWAGIEQQHDVLHKAPRALRDFFHALDEPPPWLDHDAFRPGVRAFHANVDLMLVAFVTGVLIEGFTTLIAKSFNITGRTAKTKRRLQQNNRQLMDIFYPGGLQRENDGWKLCTRVRFVHARIRALLSKSEEWDHGAWGTPLSAAHLGLAISIFSQRLLEYALRVGGRFTEEEKESVLSVWRYSGYLMGIPETILYTTGAEARKIYEVGFMCEPPPDADSIAMANGLIQAIPSVAEVTDPAEMRSVTKLAYRLSRAFIGNRVADQFEYPKTPVIGMLFFFRMKQRILRMLKGEKQVRLENFSKLLQISAYDYYGLAYELPDHAKHSKSSRW